MKRSFKLNVLYAVLFMQITGLQYCAAAEEQSILSTGGFNTGQKIDEIASMYLPRHRKSSSQEPVWAIIEREKLVSERDSTFYAEYVSTLKMSRAKINRGEIVYQQDRNLYKSTPNIINRSWWTYKEDFLFRATAPSSGQRIFDIRRRVDFAEETSEEPLGTNRPAIATVTNDLISKYGTPSGQFKCKNGNNDNTPVQVFVFLYKDGIIVPFGIPPWADINDISKHDAPEILQKVLHMESSLPTRSFICAFYEAGFLDRNNAFDPSRMRERIALEGVADGLVQVALFPERTAADYISRMVVIVQDYQLFRESKKADKAYIESEYDNRIGSSSSPRGAKPPL